MLLKIRRFAIASAIVVPAVVGLSVATSSAAPAAHFAFHVIAAPLQTGPNSNLNGSGSTVVYSPHKLDNLTAVSSANCAVTDYTFSVTNNTTKTQKMTYQGTYIPGFKIPPGEQLDICVFNDGNYKFGLVSSPAAKLKTSVTM